MANLHEGTTAGNTGQTKASEQRVQSEDFRQVGEPVRSTGTTAGLTYYVLRVCVCVCVCVLA